MMFQLKSWHSRLVRLNQDWCHGSNKAGIVLKNPDGSKKNDLYKIAFDLFKLLVEW